MKKLYITKITLLVAGLFMAFAAFSQATLEISSGDIDIKVGETVQLQAVYTDAEGLTQEVEIQWSVEPAELASIDENALLTGLVAGKGMLYAKYNELEASVELEIEEAEEEEEETPEALNILNEKIKLAPGETVQLEAEYTDADGLVQEVVMEWMVDPAYLGSIDENALFTAEHEGEGVIVATYGELSDEVEVEIEEESEEEENEIDYPKAKVVPGSVRIATGDSVELIAFFVDENDKKVDTMFTWTVEPAELGTFPDPNGSWFFAGDIAGSGQIIATVGDFSDTIKLRVIEPKGKPQNQHQEHGMKIAIVPGDTIINAGTSASLQYVAEVNVKGKGQENEALEWSLEGDPIGEIDEETGLLTLSGETGLALIKAEWGNFGAVVELLVVDPDADTEINSITIRRVLPNGHELPAKELQEGDTYKIGGLPFPLNILNGGTLHFPFGCITEDIILYMFIPEEYAETDEENGEVSFDEEIVAGIKFGVMPADGEEIAETYYFEIPVNLGLVFKHELLETLGVVPENLDVFFADNTGFFVEEGTENVAVDTVKNKIYAAIEHFSTIVVRPKSAVTFIPEIDEQVKSRLNVYPNPFTESTAISFRLEERADVELTIYNMQGQKIKTIVNSSLAKGEHQINWDGTDNSETLVAPGVYFCRLLQGRHEAEVKRLIFNR